MRIDIQRLAATAKIKIEPEMEERLAMQMEEFVSIIEKLPERHGSMSDPWGISGMCLREDIVESSLPREIVLQEAAKKSKDYFIVPKTVD